MKLLAQLPKMLLSVRALAVITAASVGDWLGVLDALCFMFK